MFLQCRKTRRICQKILQSHTVKRPGAAFSFSEISHLRSSLSAFGGNESAIRNLESEFRLVRKGSPFLPNSWGRRRRQGTACPIGGVEAAKNPSAPLDRCLGELIFSVRHPRLETSPAP